VRRFEIAGTEAVDQHAHAHAAPRGTRQRGGDAAPITSSAKM
jgi:hypothetical protein